MSLLKRPLTAAAFIQPRYPAGADVSIVGAAKAVKVKNRGAAEDFTLSAIRPQVGATGARAVFGLRQR